MYRTQLVVKNETGLHARPAADLTNLCQKFQSDITFITDGTSVNPKSIISLLSGGFSKGMEFTLQAEGPDEETAGEQITQYINNLEK